MTYSTTKFEVATSNSLGGDTFTRNMTDGQTDGRWSDFDTKLIYPFFLKKKMGIIILCIGFLGLDKNKKKLKTCKRFGQCQISIL